MTPAARIAAVIALLEEQENARRPADAVASAYFRQRRYVGAKDRAQIAGRYYQLLRHRARLAWHLARVGASDDARARTIAGLVLIDGEAPESVAALFTGNDYAPPVLSNDEKRVVAALATRTLTPSDMPAPVRVECPPWAAEPMKRALGDSFRAEMAALLDEAPLDIRVNTLRNTREEVIAALTAAGIDVASTPLSPIGVRARGRPPLASLEVFRKGGVEVQDEGSQLVSLLANARPGMQVVDFCAGAGGKSLAMAATMGGKGRIVACDVSSGRLTRAKERMKRAGVDNIEPRLLESTRDKWIKRQKGKFDLVLIDAPCSGVGAWRRNPDARWRDTDLAALTSLQTEILNSAQRLVKPGGQLVYVTCSLLCEENEDRVTQFLQDHEAFAVLDHRPQWVALTGAEAPDGPYLRLSPARTGTDGFFAAFLERRS